MSISERAALAHPWAPRHFGVLSGRKPLRQAKTKRERSALHFIAVKYSASSVTQRIITAEKP